MGDKDAIASTTISGGGVTTKEVNSNGDATALTVSQGDTVVVKEPQKITINVPAVESKKDLGVTLANLCIKKVAPNSFAKKNGSFTIGYQVYTLNGSQVKSDKEFRENLSELRKKGKAYKVVIGLSEAELKKKAEEAEMKAKEDEKARQKAEEAAALKAKAEEDARRVKERAEEEARLAREKEEEEARLAKEREEEEKRLEEERKARSNGNVRLIYEMYDQEFPIKDGSLTAEEIDEEYAMTFVMPGCHIHLSEISPTERTQLENGPDPDENVPPFIIENPPGIFHHMEVGKVYYCQVVQDEEQFQKDQTKFKRVVAGMEGNLEKPDDGRGFETCSCIYGNPCVDEYGCRDWHNRFAVAKQNGWKEAF